MLCSPAYAGPSVTPQEGEYLRAPLGRLLEGRPVPRSIERHEARVGNVVQDRDADFERHHLVVAPGLARRAPGCRRGRACSGAARSPIAGAPPFIICTATVHSASPYVAPTSGTFSAWAARISSPSSVASGSWGRCANSR